MSKLKKSIRRIRVTDDEALIIEDASGNEYLIINTDALGGAIFDPGDRADRNSWVREGQTITSAFASWKRDVPRRNSGMQGLASDDYLRATDFSLLRSGALDESGNPTKVPNNAVCTNMRVEAHDGVDHFVTGLFRVQVEGAAVENDVRSTLKYITWDGSTNSAAWTTTSDRRFGVNTTTMASRFEVNGSRGVKQTTLNAATLTLDISHDIINVDYTATGVVDIALPPAADAFNSSDGIGRIHTVKDRGNNAYTNRIRITPDGSETIDGAAYADITQNRGSLRFYSDGSNWNILY